MSATLAKGLRLLEALCYAREPVGITELSQQLDMNVSAVQRLLRTLVQSGYAEQIKSRKYQATLHAWEVGAQILRDSPLRRSVHPILRHAAHSTGYTAFFMLNNAPFATYFDKVEGQNGLTYSSELGTSVPITATASGLAMTAFLSLDAQQALHKPAMRGTVEFRPAVLKGLERRLSEIRDRRYATSESGFRKGVNSVAAPVWGADGAICGSIALTADENELRAADFVSVGQKVVRWADEASIVLGGIPHPPKFDV